MRPGSSHGGLCPGKLPGTQINFVEVEGGAALEFSNSAEQVPFLRVRVRAMAQRFNLKQLAPRIGPRRGRGPGPRHHPGCRGDCRRGPGPDGPPPEGAPPQGPGHHDEGMMFQGPPPPPSLAEAVETPTGSRLVILAGRAEDVGPLREFLSRRVQMIQEARAAASTPTEEAPAAE